ncbi:metal-dependent hydrolase [Spongiibacter sp.]|uniref:metal-dependent hydrolase n=1 Tax=Spongiibacter sp. TaxID=2024860 RepID=UPI00356961E6
MDGNNTANSATSEISKILPRNVQFDFNIDIKKYWYDDNALMTAWMCALSSMFPPGEKEFIRSIRAFEKQIQDPALQQDIKGFIGQEGFHQLNHKRVNRYLEEKTGLRVTALEQQVSDNIGDMLAAGDFSDAQLLASTVCLEHITAIMGEWMLRNKEIADPAPAIFRELILWHGVEELEHKSVAFDVYMQCVGDRKLLRRVMVATTFGFCIGLLRMQLQLLWWERKLPSLRDLWGTLKFNFGKHGVIRHVFKPYFTFFKKDFHPDNTDESALIAEWARNYPELASATK